MAKTDHSFKRLVTLCINDFAAWLLNAEVASAETRTIELPTVPNPLKSDQIFFVTLADGRTVILHIEFQGRRSRRPMPQRMLDYLTRLALLYPGVPLHSVVFYVGQGAGRADDGQHEVLDAQGNMVLAWHYHVMRLWEMDAEELLRLDKPALLALIGQTRMVAPQAVLPQAVKRIRAVPNKELQQRLLTELVALLPNEELIAMVERFIDEDDELDLDLPFMRRLRQEGQRTTLRRVIAETIGERFALSTLNHQEIIDKLAGITAINQLEQLFKTALRCADMEEFGAALAAVGIPNAEATPD